MSDSQELRVLKTPEQWRQELSSAEYHVLREAGTEAPFTGEYTRFDDVGTYACRACGATLFTSSEKFDAHCGWPSFYAPKDSTSITYQEDASLPGRPRLEVRCARCESHLGHVFEGERYETPTDQRFCINSICLTFSSQDGAPSREA